MISVRYAHLKLGFLYRLVNPDGDWPVCESALADQRDHLSDFRLSIGISGLRRRNNNSRPKAPMRPPNLSSKSFIGSWMEDLRVGFVVDAQVKVAESMQTMVGRMMTCDGNLITIRSRER
jgi:hypothetical protein